MDKIGHSSHEQRSLTNISFVTVQTIDEHMLTEDSALVVEVLDENYHQAPILGFALVNERGHFLSRQTLLLHLLYFEHGLRMSNVKKCV